MSVQATVLVVDDNDAGRFAKTAMLRRAGFSVLDAATGRDALDIVRRQPIDLVLLDINLPDMSGLDVCARIKADPRFATIQVLHISATAIEDEDKIRGLEGGADAYLAEPAHHDVVVATLNALLRVRRAEQGRAAALELEQEARRQAERANRIKDNFLARLSHELRTPLNAAVGWIALLKQGVLDADRQARALDALERSARQQWTLINELLDAASIQQRKMRLELSPVDFDGVATAVVELVRPEAARKGVELIASIEPARAHADPARLQQVITNLLNNAVQFTDEGGRVALTVGHDGADVVIRVEDSGIGIESPLPAACLRGVSSGRRADGGEGRTRSRPGHLAPHRRAARRTHPRNQRRPRPRRHLHRAHSNRWPRPGG